MFPAIIHRGWNFLYSKPTLAHCPGLTGGRSPEWRRLRFLSVAMYPGIAPPTPAGRMTHAEGTAWPPSGSVSRAKRCTGRCGRSQCRRWRRSTDSPTSASRRSAAGCGCRRLAAATGGRRRSGRGSNPRRFPSSRSGVRSWRLASTHRVIAPAGGHSYRPAPSVLTVNTVWQIFTVHFHR